MLRYPLGSCRPQQFEVNKQKKVQTLLIELSLVLPPKKMIAPLLWEDYFPMCHGGTDLVPPSSEETESAWTKLGSNQDPGEPCLGIAEQNICVEVLGGTVGREVHLLSRRNRNA